MQTETIDRLFLELSQVTQATTAKEAELKEKVDRLAILILYVASHTRDQWARDYLTTRLTDYGFDATLKDPVQTSEKL